jgi:hypothetical protein
MRRNEGLTGTRAAFGDANSLTRDMRCAHSEREPYEGTIGMVDFLLDNPPDDNHGDPAGCGCAGPVH